MQLHQEGRSLHGAFHYYCKLAEKGTELDDLSGSKQATYLSGMETMDENEFWALVCGSKLQLPKLTEASQSAFKSTIAKQQKDTGVDVARSRVCPKDLLPCSFNSGPHCSKLDIMNVCSGIA